MFGRGNPHPRNYGTFVRVLGRYVRELKVLTLEDAVRKMTAFPAQRIGLSDRGVLREGMRADISIFDPALVRDRSTFEQPHQYAEGVDLVIVNGLVVFESGSLTTARPGRILYGPAAVDQDEPGAPQDHLRHRHAARPIRRAGADRVQLRGVLDHLLPGAHL